MTVNIKEYVFVMLDGRKHISRGIDEFILEQDVAFSLAIDERLPADELHSK